MAKFKGRGRPPKTTPSKVVKSEVKIDYDKDYDTLGNDVLGKEEDSDEDDYENEKEREAREVVIFIFEQ